MNSSDAANYRPTPIETGGVEPTAEVLALTEKLAENAHELWAKERVAQGWTFGPKRDDEAKTHPCLIPYANLPDEEKRFDREAAMGTLKAMLALGYVVDRPSPSPGGPEIEGQAGPDVGEWSEGLDAAFAEATAPGAARGWTFDMDDAPEIATLPEGSCTVARAALQHLQDTVFPAWRKADARALAQQKFHRKVASVSIGAGVLAIVCAVLQLFVQHFADGNPSSTAESVNDWLEKMELGLIVLAALAVVVGFLKHLHHGWLAARQTAERLRILKFESLAWPELWCHFDQWREKVTAAVDQLEQIQTKSAHEWAMAGDSVTWSMPRHANCRIMAGDLAVVSKLYRVKRLQFQQHYFNYQSQKANSTSRIVDWKIGIFLFALTVIVVLLHALHLEVMGMGKRESNLCLVTLAALFPVVGFGLRAWLAAFETPRSRNLYRAKAHALESYLKSSRESARNPEMALVAMAQAEQFFTHEHREWCRLQMEAEWFV